MRAPLVFGIHVVGHFPWRLPFSDILSMGFPSRQTWNDLVKANSYQDQSSTDMLRFQGVIFFQNHPPPHLQVPKTTLGISFSDTYSTLTSMMYPGCQPTWANDSVALAADSSATKTTINIQIRKLIKNEKNKHFPGKWKKDPHGSHQSDHPKSPF